MAYDADRVVELVEAALDRQDAALEPGFYAVVGSHAFGFPTPASDVDVRGMHVADGRRYMLLDTPVERVTVNRDGVTEGYEDWADVELVTHELRALVGRLHRTALSAIETLLAGEVVLDTVPEYTDALRDVVASALPMDVPEAYRGMARRVREAHLAPGADAKHHLHALRAAMAAADVAERGELHADVATLSRSVLGDADVVEDLVAVRRAGETPDEDLHERTVSLLDSLLADGDDRDPPDGSGEWTRERDHLRDRLDRWMLDLRHEVTQPLGE